MTAQHPDILTATDAEILRRLRRIVEAGAYYRSFTADDVTRVANRWLTAPQAPVVPLRIVQPKQLDHDAPAIPLTPRQAEVLTELCRGNDNKTIAENLYITESGVRKHLLRIWAALGENNRTEVIRMVVDGKVRIVTEAYRKKAS